jgi:hypothetical protein
MTLYGPSALVYQAEELSNILDVMRGELLYHLLIPHILVKCNHNRCIGDTRDGIANLREPVDEGAQRFSQALLDGVEVSLIARSRGGTLKVARELTAQLLLTGQHPLG